MTKRDQRLQEIREQIEIQRDMPLDLYPDLDDVEWLLAEVEWQDEALDSVESLNDELREILVSEGYNVEALEHHRKASR